jgi:hypothetical protein
MSKENRKNIITDEELLQYHQEYLNGDGLSVIAKRNNIITDTLKLRYLKAGYKLKDYTLPENLSIEKLHEISNRTKNGESLEKICKDYGFSSRKNLLYHLLQLDIPYVEYKSFNFTDEQIELFKKLHNEGCSLDKMENLLYTSYDTLIKLYKKYNLTPNQPRTIYTDENIEKLRKLHSEGVKVKDMVNILNFSDKTIGLALKSLGLSTKRVRILTEDEINFIKNNLGILTKTSICYKLNLTSEIYEREITKLKQ